MENPDPKVLENQDPAGAAGSVVVDWKQSLPEEYRGNPALEKFKTPADLFRGYTELEKYVGHEKIAMPRRDKDGRFVAEDMERVLQQLGKPKESKEYTVPKDLKTPKGMTLDDNTMAGFKDAAHKLGILPHQFEGVLQYFAGMLTQGEEAKNSESTRLHNEAVVALKSKWGIKYDENAKLANMVLSNFTDKKQAAQVIEKYGNDPLIIEMLAGIGENLSEEVLQRTGIKGGLLTPEAAQAEINSIKGNAQHPYFVATHPEHEYWVNRMTELYRMSGQ